MQIQIIDDREALEKIQEEVSRLAANVERILAELQAMKPKPINSMPFGVYSAATFDDE